MTYIYLRFKKQFIELLLFSLLITILNFSYPVFMLQVYNRVLTSGSITTLILLLVICIIGILGSSIFTKFRDGINSFISLQFAEFPSNIENSGHSFSRTEFINKIKHTDEISNAIKKGLISDFFDILFSPVFLIALYLISPFFVFIVLTIALLCYFLNEKSSLTRKKLETGLNEIERAKLEKLSYLTTSYVVNTRKKETKNHLQKLYCDVREKAEVVIENSVNQISNISVEFLRKISQPIILAYGAYLVIDEDLNPGLMIIAIIISSQALNTLLKVHSTYSSYKEVKNAISVKVQIEGKFKTKTTLNTFIEKSFKVRVNAGEVESDDGLKRVLVPEMVIELGKIYLIKGVAYEKKSLFSESMVTYLDSKSNENMASTSLSSNGVSYVNDRDDLKFTYLHEFFNFTEITSKLDNPNLLKIMIKFDIINLIKEAMTKSIPTTSLPIESKIILKILVSLTDSTNIKIYDIELEDRSNRFIRVFGDVVNHILSSGNSALIISNNQELQIKGAIEYETS